jgi:tetratricopeptide (TPR) repeat protein
MVPTGAYPELDFLGGSGLPVRRHRGALRYGLACVAAVATLVAPSSAQKTSHGPSTGSGSPTSGPVMGQQQQPSYSVVGMQPDAGDPFSQPLVSMPGIISVTSDSARSVESEACNSWTESGIHSPTVSLARLEVPDKASSEFQKACSSYKNKKLSEAEGHVRKALGIYPQYAASWVLLGQVLDAEHHEEEAGKACSQGAVVDPKYIAPYLCLAEFAARSDDWKQVSQLSGEALAINPTSNAYALYYSAAADFHLQKSLPDAEEHARTAADLDTWHHLPQVHLLLANIYASKGDPHSEEAELKEFLKVAPNSPDAPAVRAMLKEVTNPASPAPPSQPAPAAQHQP